MSVHFQGANAVIVFEVGKKCAVSARRKTITVHKMQQRELAIVDIVFV